MAHRHQHKYLDDEQGDDKMKLSEIIDFEVQKRNIERIKQSSKQQAAYAKSAQAWFELQKAEANEQKARQRYIQAAQAFSHSAHP
jgi:hypothetical protein